jgi:hypothetical protein
MLKVLFGSLKINRGIDYAILPLKIVYIVYTTPFLIFAFLMNVRSFGAFSSSSKEKFGIVKKILLHLSAIFLSFGMWIVILSILEKTLNFKIRLHLFS